MQARSVVKWFIPIQVISYVLLLVTAYVYNHSIHTIHLYMLTRNRFGWRHWITKCWWHLRHVYDIDWVECVLMLQGIEETFGAIRRQCDGVKKCCRKENCTSLFRLVEMVLLTYSRLFRGRWQWELYFCHRTKTSSNNRLAFPWPWTCPLPDYLVLGAECWV